MSTDTRYISVEYTYKSIGLYAREQIDQCPPFSYLNLLNGYERAENLMSSRYGVVIVNRDPSGTGTSNYFFGAPVTTLAKLAFQSAAYRYAGLGNGTIFRRPSNTQGQYFPLPLPGNQLLSGSPMQYVVASCFETAQPYIFFYDSNFSFKDNGTFTTAEVTGIDAPQYTANAIPYAPLLVMIDDFAAGNSYSTSNVSGWAHEAVQTLSVVSGQDVTDFTEFFGTTSSGGGGSTYPPSTSSTSTSVTQSGPGTSTNISSVISGWPSVVPSPGEAVTLSVQFANNISAFEGGGAAIVQVSTDGGATWSGWYYSSTTLSSQLISQTLPSAVTNINLVQVRIFVTATGSPGGFVTVSSSISYAFLTLGGGGMSSFGVVANGMIANLSTNVPISVPILTVTASDLNNGAYLFLTVVTQSAHGLTPGNEIGLYWTSSSHVDGYYPVITVLSPTSFTVPFYTTIPLSAQGGFVTGGGGVPANCVIYNEFTVPYPPQFSAFGFYNQVPTYQDQFPVGAFSGSIAASTTGTISQTLPIDLSQNNQITSDDLIVITLSVSNPNAVSEIVVQFNVADNSGTNYYQKSISPAYYQPNIAGNESAYLATQSQILADTLGLITGQPPNTTSAQLQPSNFNTGPGSWVACYLRRGDFLPVGQAGASGLDWANVAGWKVSITTNSTGSSTVAINGLYLQGGFGPSSFAGIGYDYRYTFYNANTGTESSPSPIQAFNLQYGYLSSQAAPIVLRQAFQVTGVYSNIFLQDFQATHVRWYRRGGTRASNWFQIDQVPVPASFGAGTFTTFFYKDVISDAQLTEAQPLILDNDPPVTSSLVNPIVTTLAAPTVGPTQTPYTLFAPQTVVINSSATLVPEMIVEVGDVDNLELVTIIGNLGQTFTGNFSSIFRLQHNAGEPVAIYALPRAKCNLCAIAYNQVWLAGDVNNPNYLYYSKPGLPENFGPQNYIPIGSPQFPITVVIFWRGLLFVSTTETWYQIFGGAQPYAQPTGSTHGAVASQGWTEIESGILYRAADGQRVFAGADGAYLSLPVEWVYRQQPFGPLPLADPSQASADVMAFYNQTVYTSYVSLTNSGERFRLNYDLSYRRFRNDDLGATAMLWERDTNQLLLGIPTPGQGGSDYAVVIDQNYTQDYDDGGWSFGNLVQVPISLTIQTPYRDMGKPHFPKQFNVVEVDANTQGQALTTTLLFLTEPPTSLPLAATTTSQRQKTQLQVNDGEGAQAYSVAVQHTIEVLTAPLIYQENIYAAILADYRSSYDTYWIKFGSDLSKIVKDGYFDYSGTTPIEVDLFADDGSGGGSDSSLTPYFTFTLPGVATRESIRVLFPPKKCRLWRLVATCDQPFQWWVAPLIRQKSIGPWGSTYTVVELSI